MHFVGSYYGVHESCSVAAVLCKGLVSLVRKLRAV